MIKIGWSERFPRRVPQIAALFEGDGAELMTLGVLDGGKAEEWELHRRFAAHRVWPDREWFRPDPELLAFIHGHARPYVPIEEDPDARAEADRARLVTVQVHAGVVHDAKQVARAQGLTLAEYLSRAIGAATERDLGAIASED